MIKLKDLIIEGTRWSVGIEAPNGKIASTYGHYDGYPEHEDVHVRDGPRPSRRGGGRGRPVGGVREGPSR